MLEKVPTCQVRLTCGTAFLARCHVFGTILCKSSCVNIVSELSSLCCLVPVFLAQTQTRAGHLKGCHDEQKDPLSQH